MKIINSDSSEAEMCGNGIRCFARFLTNLDKQSFSENNVLKVETIAGIIEVEFKEENQIQVNMGVPILQPDHIPTTFKYSSVGIPQGQLNISGTRFNAYAVGMGNPHLILYPEGIEDIDYIKVGPILELNEAFPNKTNVHFVEVIDRETIKIIVWERGCGLTMACGTGACASVVSSIILGLTDTNVEAILPGGKLYIQWLNKKASVFMKGPGEFVFEGILDVSNFL
tara:strand:- start:503 stop:1180 length:678 start_codon:yes stop_codon:yes gene_type:complete